MKDAKGHGSDPRGAHSAGVQQVGTFKGMPLTQEGLEHLDIDTLDKAAFGYKSGDQIQVGLKDVIPEHDDMENALYQRSLAANPQQWAQTVLKNVNPIELEIRQDGKLHVADGHHRLLAADTLGQKVPGNIEIKAKPIKQILEHGIKS